MTLFCHFLMTCHFLKISLDTEQVRYVLSNFAVCKSAFSTYKIETENARFNVGFWSFGQFCLLSDPSTHHGRMMVLKVHCGIYMYTGLKYAISAAKLCLHSDKQNKCSVVNGCLFACCEHHSKQEIFLLRRRSFKQRWAVNENVQDARCVVDIKNYIILSYVIDV